MGNLLGGASTRASPELVKKGVEGFASAFHTPDDPGCAPTTLGVAPGRAEVVGNHTDYNEGLVIGCAIDRYVVIAGRLAPNGSTKCRLASETFPQEHVEVDLADAETGDFAKLKQTGKRSWANYVIGVVSELSKIGVKVGGFDAFVASDVPPGAGVSSSAALEMATGMLLSRLFPDTVGKLDTLTIVKVAKAAENNYVGVGCGILDQYCSGMGQEGSLICIDCRTVTHELVPLSGAQFVLANTNAPHALADGKYDELRKMCFSAATTLKSAMASDTLTHLRDVSVEDFEKHKDKLSPEEQRHASHIVYENSRVAECVEACKAGDMEIVGKALSASHISSRDSFRNSSKELDIMQRCAEGIDGHLGSRLMGGGFGGSTINLVREGHTEGFIEELRQRYLKETGIEPTIWACKPGQGAYHQDV